MTRCDSGAAKSFLGTRPDRFTGIPTRWVLARRSLLQMYLVLAIDAGFSFASARISRLLAGF